MYYRVYFRPFLLADNGSENSVLNRVLELNLVQQKIFNPNMRNTVSFYCLIKHWILHIACIFPALWLKIFVLLKFHNYTKLNLVGGERNWMERDSPSPLAAFSSLQSIKRHLTFLFKLNLVLKKVAASFWNKLYYEQHLDNCNEIWAPLK